MTFTNKAYSHITARRPTCQSSHPPGLSQGSRLVSGTGPARGPLVCAFDCCTCTALLGPEEAPTYLGSVACHLPSQECCFPYPWECLVSSDCQDTRACSLPCSQASCPCQPTAFYRLTFSCLVPLSTSSLPHPLPGSLGLLLGRVSL